MDSEFFDVLIVGAGLSGIGAACHLQRRCPGKRFAILEARATLGGTWDLFRYPGIRADSDMYTLAYSFRPWTGERAITDGATMLAYLRETAQEHDVERHIRFGCRMESAAWSSTSAQWRVSVVREGGERATLRCNFLLVCSGYYDYARPYLPDFPGRERFAGRLVHPQQWSDDIAVKGQRIVVIGSGATAVSLIPELARSAAQVTMLQRSPTYMVARPSIDPLAAILRRHLPPRLASALTRWKNVLLGMYVFRVCRTKPQKARAVMIDLVSKQLDPGYDVGRHFSPRYGPWEQRLCLVPDGDLFKAIRAGSVNVVTDQIETFTETGIRLKSGAELPADLVVAATGLTLNSMGGATMEVDGQRIDAAQLVSYKGLMFGGVPNFAQVFGYTNASWTLKADLASSFVCRVLEHMGRAGVRSCTPQLNEAGMALQPWVDFSSGYFQRALAQLPKQGTKAPWKLNQNYLVDVMALRFGAVDDGVLRFS